MNILNCWNCKWFKPDNVASALTGQCRRKAPANMDYRSNGLRESYSTVINVEYLQAGVSAGGVLLPLYSTGESLPTCHATEATGLDSNDINPVSIPAVEQYFIVGAQVNASRLNSGAGTVGPSPVVKVQQIYVRGDDQEIYNDGYFEIPVNAAYVRPSGDTTDRFIQNAAIYNTPDTKVPSGANLIGYRLDLTGSTPDDIAEVRNFKLGLALAVIHDFSLSPPTSAAKWAIITDATVQWCGEYTLSIGVIPPLPVAP